MEIKIKLPGGGYVKFRLGPVERERFMAICILAGIFIVGSGILKFFSLLIGA